MDSIDPAAAKLLERACEGMRCLHSIALVFQLDDLLGPDRQVYASEDTYSSVAGDKPGCYAIQDPYGVVVLEINISGSFVRWQMPSGVECEDLKILARAIGLRLPGGCMREETLADRLYACGAMWPMMTILTRSGMPDLQQDALIKELADLAEFWHAHCVRVVNGEYSGGDGYSHAGGDDFMSPVEAACKRTARQIIERYKQWLERIELQPDPRGHPVKVQLIGFARNGRMHDFSVPPDLLKCLGAAPRPAARDTRHDVFATTEADADGSRKAANKTTARAAKPKTLSVQALAKKMSVRASRVDSSILDVLSQARVIGRHLMLDAKLEPRLYKRVDAFLNSLGGFWTASVGAHVFEDDFDDVLQSILQTGTATTSKDYEFFQTQREGVEHVIAHACIAPGMKVLEPQAGRGALALAAAEIVGKDSVTCYELMPANVRALQALGFEVDAPQDFLLVTPEPVYDVVCMNPPFSGGRDVAHMLHAMRFLKDGGRLVSLASHSVLIGNTAAQLEFRELVAAMNGTITLNPQTFYDGVSSGLQTVIVSTDISHETLQTKAPQKAARNPHESSSEPGATPEACAPAEPGSAPTDSQAPLPKAVAFVFAQRNESDAQDDSIDEILSMV